MGNPWPNCSNLPRGAAAVLAALHLGSPSVDALSTLNERDCREALDFSYKSRLTLALRAAARDSMPALLRDRTDQDAAKNVELLSRREALYRNLAGTLDSAGVPFLALKGLTHCALFGSRRDTRVQYDVDLYSPPDRVRDAEAALIASGYHSMEGMERFPTDHLPALVLKNRWEWRGDYFDPDMAVSVELHFQFWNPVIERLPAPGNECFWERRVLRPIGGVDMAMLCPADALAYASLHLLKHLLRGSVSPYHVYEIACVLDSHGGNAAFWKEWRALHSPELRRLQAVAFQLSREWFGCAIAPAPQEELDRLPSATKIWFRDFATSPACRLYRADKDELWLHLSLLSSRRDIWSVMRRRLLPGNLPPPISGHIPEDELTLRQRFRRSALAASYFASRVRHHTLAFPRAVLSGAQWWWRTR